MALSCLHFTGLQSQGHVEDGGIFHQLSPLGQWLQQRLRVWVAEPRKTLPCSRESLLDDFTILHVGLASP
jgi:hypothetical protein